MRKGFEAMLALVRAGCGLGFAAEVTGVSRSTIAKRRAEVDAAKDLSARAVVELKRKVSNDLDDHTRPKAQ